MNKQQKAVELGETMIGALAEHMTIGQIMIAIHNVCLHGEIFEETGEDVNEEQLGEIFDHFDAIIGILK